METSSGGGGLGGTEEIEPKKSFKLSVFTKTFYTEDLIIRNEDFPDIRPGDVIEIYHAEETFSRLLIEVKLENLYPENKLNKSVLREVVYLEKGIAETFKLNTFKNVIVNKVDRSTVTLDVVELLFKDQYMGRSEMWRLKKQLMDSVVFTNKQICACKDTIRCSVLEMWNQGVKLACGVVTQDTKVVFRSTTAMVYLFIQMSTEMWHFDMYGDLYFEKAVNGFLYEMFYKWKKAGAAHEVTIVLFSRIFYDAKELNDFPPYMISCLQKDYRDRFYEDFYRVAVQNERFEDWFPTLNLLRQTFTNYKELILNYHKRPGVSIPKASISTAAQGNFLEVLNISLNTFEKHFINRNLDRTGQQAMVITPGVGIFEVDRDLTVITKQRMIDSGVGSDLICVGEQPLHAVPLFKMYSKGGQPRGQEDFSMPWWINLSFHTSNRKIGYSSFIPRIKLPPLRKGEEGEVKETSSCYFPLSIVNSKPPDSPFEYDVYDAEVFNMQVHKTYNIGSLPRNKKTRKLGVRKGSSDLKLIRAEGHRKTSRQGSYDDSYMLKKESNITPSISIPANLKEGKKSDMPEIYSRSFGGEIEPRRMQDPKTFRGSYDDGHLYPISTSAFNTKFLFPSGRALINPFDPSHATVKLTSNRRRWTHIFSRGPAGGPRETQRGSRANSKLDQKSKNEGRDSPSDSSSSVVTSTPHKDITEYQLSRIADISLGLQSEIGNISKAPRHRSVSNSEVKFGTYMWGATAGEQTWDATLATGVDWKSITYPACLPITTDYLPDQRTLDTEYFISDYNLSPEEHNSDFISRSPLQKPPLSTREVYLELISQRLAQNFQLIVQPKEESSDRQEANLMAVSAQRNSLVRHYKKPPAEIFWLSIGKIFHKITLTGQMINVVRHSPKHPYPNLHYRYRYRFQAPDNDTYEISWVEFNMEKLETYNWNYLDFYVCTRGDQDYYLSESLKYWRYRLYVLPLKQFLPYTKSISEGPQDMRCDIYQKISLEDRVNLAEGFMRFIETCINKIKRPTPAAAEKPMQKGRSYTMAGESSRPPGLKDRVHKFRERTGSNRGLEKGRDRTLSGPAKHITERSRTESGSARDFETLKPLSSNSALSETSSDSQESVFNPQLGIFELQHKRKLQWRKVFLGIKDKEKMYKRGCSNEEIVEGMRNATSGLTILPKQDALPANTFVSADAVVWLLEHVEGIFSEKDAIEVMSGLQKEGLICHACGHPQHPFFYGFYLYYFVTKDHEGSPYGEDWEAFQADWIEVELDYHRLERDEEDELQFLQVDLPDSSASGTGGFRSSTLDPDLSKKSERPEWGQSKYQARYRPDQAFEFLLKWSVATGAVIGELIRTWTSRAQTNQLSIIPIPGDPFALPSQSSDPIRGPIFVPLKIECLRDGNRHMFSMFEEKSWDHRLFLFREAIVKRFGFISCVTDPKHQASSATFSTTHQYSHCTGNMFVLIPTGLQPHIGIQGIKPKEMLKREKSEVKGNEGEVPEPESESFISRHPAEESMPLMYAEEEDGFLWSWNFMISKKWKSMSVTGATGDIPFMDKMLSDFRRFCMNEDGRLKEFWDHCLTSQSLQPQ